MPQIATVKSSVLDRFLRYVTYDTQSAEDSSTYPSTLKQLALLDDLAKELKAIGLADASRDEHGYVMATIPATTKKSGVPVIGFLAHVDTSPELSGAGVKPIVHRNYQGGDIVLPDDPRAVLKRAEVPALATAIGKDIVTASGTTLLGADDKTGVAEIMTAAEYLLAHPEIPHGPIRIGFTPDEEVGGGTTYFDVPRFGAKFAYTLDGESAGNIEGETFSGDALVVRFHGFNAHPGFAKGIMVNSIKVASDFIGRLPRNAWSPETTEKREAYVHPYVLEGGVDHTSVKFILRDFVTAGLRESEAKLKQLASETVAAWPGASVTFEVLEGYRNLKEVLDRHPEILENAREAVRRVGLTPVDQSIRGGTDGSKLSFMGLPTANLFAGQHNFHSRLEWVAAEDMEKAVEMIVELAKVWEERA